MSFEAFAAANGVIIDHVHPVASIQRCPTAEHPRSKNGAWYWDGKQGWVCAWDAGGEIQWYSDPDREWTAADKATWAKHRVDLRAKDERKHALAAERAHEMLRDCMVAEHGYLRLKGFPKARGLVTKDDDLFVPMRRISGELVGGQLIRWDAEGRKWEKKMLPGMRAKGAVLSIGSPWATETILCEGYATGLSIHAAITMTRLDARALVCFSDSNLAHVAPTVPGRVMVFADNDESGAGERAAKATGRPYCMRLVVGQDANDMHMTSGIYAVGKAITEMRMR